MARIPHILGRLSLADLRRLVGARERREKLLPRLERKRAKLLKAVAKVEDKISRLDHGAGGGRRRRAKKARKFSAAARRKMAASARARWAKAKAPKRKYTAASRRAMSLAAKRRWAKEKAEAPG